MENISVNLSAEYGTIFLSPMLMQFWQPLSSGLSVNRGDGEAEDLILEGRAEVINIALQSIKYLGYCKLDGIYLLHLIKLYDDFRMDFLLECIHHVFPWADLLHFFTHFHGHPNLVVCPKNFKLVWCLNPQRRCINKIFLWLIMRIAEDIKMHWGSDIAHYS